MATNELDHNALADGLFYLIHPRLALEQHSPLIDAALEYCAQKSFGWCNWDVGLRLAVVAMCDKWKFRVSAFRMTLERGERKWDLFLLSTSLFDCPRAEWQVELFSVIWQGLSKCGLHDGFIRNSFSGEHSSFSQLLERFEFLQPWIPDQYMRRWIFCRTWNSLFAQYLLDRFGPFDNCQWIDTSICNVPSLKVALEAGCRWELHSSRIGHMLPLVAVYPPSELKARQVLELLGKLSIFDFEATTLSKYLRVDRNAFICGENFLALNYCEYSPLSGVKRAVERLTVLRLMKFPWSGGDGSSMSASGACAAFCAGFISNLPSSSEEFVICDTLLLWSERSHRYFSANLRNRIFATLLLFNRFNIPRDLRRLLIDLIVNS